MRSHNLVPYTANTIIDPDELLKQIRQTRERGYGIVISELYDFVACISIPVISQDNRVLGALNFSTKPEHFDTLNNEKFISDVTNTIRNAQFHYDNKIHDPPPGTVPSGGSLQSAEKPSTQSSAGWGP